MFAQTDAFPLLTNCKIFANFVREEDKLLSQNRQDIGIVGGFKWWLGPERMVNRDVTSLA